MFLYLVNIQFFYAIYDRDVVLDRNVLLQELVIFGGRGEVLRKDPVLDPDSFQVLIDNGVVFFAATVVQSEGFCSQIAIAKNQVVVLSF